MASHEIGDVIAGAVAALVSRVQTRQRVGDHVSWCVGGVEQLHQRHGDVLVAKMPKRLDHRRSQHLVGQQRHQTRRRESASDLCQCLNRGERQEEIALERNLGQCLAGLGGVQVTERFDHMEAYVDVLIAQTCDECGNRPAIAPLAEDQRGLDAQVRVLVLEEMNHRFDNVDVADRQEIERAAQHREIAMLGT